MRNRKWWLSLGIWSVLGGAAVAAQEFTTPNSARFGNYDYFAESGLQPPDQDNQPSPSDLVIPPTESPLPEIFSGQPGVLECEDDACEPWHLLQPRGRGWQLTGWLDVGGTANDESPASHFNGPWNWNGRDEIGVNQLYASFGKQANSGGCGLDFGGQIDLLYGTDFRFAQARGLELNPDGTDSWNSHRFYGLAMPQAYGEIAYNSLSLRVGHFYAPLGYEAVTATSNFFYSRSYSFQYGMPFTFTGALATWNYSDEVQFLAGAHNGHNALDLSIDTTGIFGGIKLTPDCRPWWLYFAATSGDEPSAISAVSRANSTTYVMVVNYNLTEKWQYVFEHRLGVQQDGVRDVNLNRFCPAEWYGINQYLYYTINSCWKAGLRAEWFRDDDGVRVLGQVPGNPNQGPYTGNFFEYAVGLNYTPNANLIARPEIRWDRFDGTGIPFNDGAKNEQFTFAMDVILKY